MTLCVATRSACIQCTITRTLHHRWQTSSTANLAAQSRPYSTGYRSYSSYPGRYRYSSSVSLATAAVLGLFYAYSGIEHVYAEGPSSHIELPLGKLSSRAEFSKEQKRDTLSSQHLQVKRSWENPGVYAWGSNACNVAAPDSDEPYVKTPRRIPDFDNILLRDLKLDSNFAAAIRENGDLIEWGAGYAPDQPKPVVILRGKNLKSLALSRDRIIALSENGAVYSLPVSKKDQEGGPKPTEGSWFPFWTSRPKISYKRLEPRSLGFMEKVTMISGGLDHVLLLTNSGRVFSAPSGSQSFPSRGQLGIPGLTSSPLTENNTCYEVTTLRGFKIAKVSAGDFHSLVLDREGRVFSFGDNSCGQLGFEYSAEAPFVDAPSLLSTQKLYAGSLKTPKITDVAAGGVNSFFTVDATRVAGPKEKASEVRNLGQITADTWACGQGIKGSLGNGRWTHVQGTPTKVQSLSGLFEYDEKNSKVIPIRMAQISVGSNHASAIMDNLTYLDSSEKSSENDTNWGADVLWWGGNDSYQLGTGKRNNVTNPIYIRPLDMAAEVEVGRKDEHRFHLTPRHRANIKGQKVDVEQRIECGRNITAVYSAV